ncbi:MAG: carboxypeptidase regulatory-like domain-containing protein [Anaerolineae bacterium]|nr:carboxypeptidase regulatory-like domain-containing protein [Anaerolineae bacterium]
MRKHWLLNLIIAFASVAWGISALFSQPPLLAAATPTPAPAKVTPTPEPSPGTVFGVVRNEQGPVAGARVRLQLAETHTTTAADGSFTLTGVTATQPVTVTAWASGHYNGWTQAIAGAAPVTITLTAHYTSDNLDYDWYSFEGVEGSKACGLCHTANAEWEADAHAQAAINPRFLTMYMGTDIHGNKNSSLPKDNLGKPLPPDLSQPYYGPGFRLDYPDRAGNCAACHTPAASKLEPANTCGWSGCHSSTTAAYSDQVPDGVSPLYLTGDAAEGISCEFCHKIGEVFLVPETGLPHPDKPGISSVRLYRPAGEDQLFFGTFDDVSRPADSYLPLLEESAFCAPCHYGVFDGVAGDMTVADGVVIYNSFGEWLASPYSDPETGQTCQDCHMPAGTSDYFVFPEKGGLRRDPQHIRSHRMPGAADKTLLQNAVTMTATARLAGDQVQVEVSLTNDKTGHSVPTDSPLRHMILVVQASDAANRELPLQVGPQLPDWTGNYAGRPGQVYAQILEDEWTGESPTGAFWRPIRLISDTRLKAMATDVSRYSFTLPDNGSAKIEVRLIYRRAFQQLMQWKGWTDPDMVMEEATLTVERSE